MKRLPRVESEWSAVMQTLEGHLAYVSAAAFLPDGKVLASASYDKMVKLLEAGTGAALQTLQGH
jgi:WD40 repeat protein